MLTPFQPIPKAAKKDQALHTALLAANTKGITRSLKIRGIGDDTIQLENKESIEILLFAVLYCPQKTITHLIDIESTEPNIEIELEHYLGDNWTGCIANPSCLAIHRNDPELLAALLVRCGSSLDDTPGYQALTGSLIGHKNRELTNAEVELLATTLEILCKMPEKEAPETDIEQLLLGSRFQRWEPKKLHGHPKLLEIYPKITSVLSEALDRGGSYWVDFKQENLKRAQQWLQNLAADYLKKRISQSSRARSTTQGDSPRKV